MSHQFYGSLEYMTRWHTFSNISGYLCSDSAMTFYKTVLCYYSLSSSFFYMTSFLFSLFLYPPEENGRVPLKARDYKASNSTKSGVMCVYSSSDYTFPLYILFNGHFRCLLRVPVRDFYRGSSDPQSWIIEGQATPKCELKRVT